MLQSPFATTSHWRTGWGYSSTTLCTVSLCTVLASVHWLQVHKHCTKTFPAWLFRALFTAPQTASEPKREMKWSSSEGGVC